MPRTFNYKTMKPREFPIWGRNEMSDIASIVWGSQSALSPQFKSLARIDKADKAELRQLRRAFIWLSSKVRLGTFYWFDPVPNKYGFPRPPHVEVFIECKNRAEIFNIRWGHLFKYKKPDDTRMLQLGRFKKRLNGSKLGQAEIEPMLRWLTGNNGYDDPAPLPRHRVRASQPHRCVIDRD